MSGYKTSLEESSADGAFKRSESAFRQWIGSAEFPAETGRYHLYISYACPWASRCMAVRAFKGLEDAISVTVVEPVWGTVNPETKARGWVFAGASGAVCHIEGAEKDTVNGKETLFDIYRVHNPEYAGKATVPLLFDKKTSKVVNNESSEIIEMFDSKFNAFAKHPDRTMFPAELKDAIAREGDRMYNTINNGVYRCGFARSQEAYEQAYHELFATLDYYEELLSKQRYVCGDTFTSADLRLYVTIVRFDAVYVCYFKTNRNRIADMPNLSGWLRDVYTQPGIADTTNMLHIKNHYFRSHADLNPRAIVPLGPIVDLTSPHNRENVGTK